MNNMFQSLNKNQQSSQQNSLFQANNADQQNKTGITGPSGLTGDTKKGPEMPTTLPFGTNSNFLFGQKKTEEQQSSLQINTGALTNSSQPQTNQSQTQNTNQNQQFGLQKQFSFNPTLLNASTTNQLIQKNEATKANEQESKPVTQEKPVGGIISNPFANKQEGAKLPIGAKEENKNPTIQLANTLGNTAAEGKPTVGNFLQGNTTKNQSMTAEKSDQPGPNLGLLNKGQGQVSFRFTNTNAEAKTNDQSTSKQPTGSFFNANATDKQEATEAKNPAETPVNVVTTQIKDKPEHVVNIPSKDQSSTIPANLTTTTNTFTFPKSGSDISFFGTSNLFGGPKKEAAGDSTKVGNALPTIQSTASSFGVPKQEGEKTVPVVKKEEATEKMVINLNQPGVSKPGEEPSTVKASGGVSIPTSTTNTNTQGGMPSFVFKAPTDKEKEKGKETTGSGGVLFTKPVESVNTNTPTVTGSKADETEKLFSKKEKKDTTEAGAKGQEGKEELKLAEPKILPDNKKNLDTLAIEGLSKKSIQDVINKWKSELDSQVEKFELTGDRLKNFELTFQRNFESICSLNDLITNLKEEAASTLGQMKDISTEEDQIIDQLNFIEKSLDQYLEVADKRDTRQMVGVTENKGYIYSTAVEISKSVDDIQKVIDEVNDKVSQSSVMVEKEDVPYKEMKYENLQQKETLFLDKNEFTNILNSYYNSLRSIQFLEQNLMSKISQAEYEINQRKKEKEGH